MLKSVSLRGFWDSVIVSTYLHSFMPQVLRCVVDRGGGTPLCLFVSSTSYLVLCIDSLSFLVEVAALRE